MVAILEDFEKAPVSDRDRALYRFAARVAGRTAEVTAEDAAAARAAGWSDEALYDAATVVALFRFYNTWCDACGVRPMPPEAHAASGKRLAALGYV